MVLTFIQVLHGCRQLVSWDVWSSPIMSEHCLHHQPSSTNAHQKRPFLWKLLSLQALYILQSFLSILLVTSTQCQMQLYLMEWTSKSSYLSKGSGIQIYRFFFFSLFAQRCHYWHVFAITVFEILNDYHQKGNVTTILIWEKCLHYSTNDPRQQRKLDWS